MKQVVTLGSLLLLAACQNPAPISNAPLAPVAGPANIIVNGLQASEYNLDQAIAIGVLKANDPADACVHAALIQIGAEPQAGSTTPQPPPQQFTPKVVDLISAGSVAYIRAQQLKSLSGNVITPPAACEQLIGHFVLTSANAPAGAIISATNRLLP